MPIQDYLTRHAAQAVRDALADTRVVLTARSVTGRLRHLGIVPPADLVGHTSGYLSLSRP